MLLLIPLGCGGTSGPAADAADAAAPDAGEDAPRSDRAITDAPRSDRAITDQNDDSPSPHPDAPDAADASADGEDGGLAEAGACTGEPLSAADSAAYFPFTVGARWMFRGTGTSNDIPVGPRVFRREVTGTKMFGAASAAVVFGPEHDLDPPTLDEYVEVTAGGVVDHGSSKPPSQYERVGRYAAPFTTIPFPLQPFGPYQPFNASTTIADQDGDGVPEPVRAQATTTLTFEEITVPAGTFTKALRVESTEDLAITYSKLGGTSRTGRRTIDWYAPGVGPIKRYVERQGVKTTSELIAYSVADARRGVVSTGWVAQGIDQAASNPYKPNRPAVGYDGNRFLVVVPTSKPVGSVGSIGNLKAIVVDREGKPVSSNTLLDSGSEMQGVSMAWDGTRYLVAYHNAGYGRLEMLTVSPAGETINGPVVLEPEGAIPSVVATKSGFLVAYTRHTKETGRLRDIARMWLAAVDGQAHPTSKVQTFTTSQQWSPVLALDGAGGVLALFNTPPATPSPTSPETADILAAARLTADGHAVDATPFAVDAVPGAGHEDTQVAFDGTNFLAQWSQRADSSTVKMRVARITTGGMVLDGSMSGGIVVGGGGSPRLARFGSGSLIVWGHLLPNFEGQGIAGTRLTTDGRLLDVPGDAGGRWFLADYGTNRYSLTEMVWAGDRALIVWANQASNEAFDIGCALAYPW